MTLVKRLFTRSAVDELNTPPWDDGITWAVRHVELTDQTGNAIFSQDVEAPTSWSDTAVTIAASKYLSKQLGETSIKQLILRVVKAIDDGYHDRGLEECEVIGDELAYLLVNQMLAFNSPVWFNLGVDEHPQCSACFILAVQDDMGSILDLVKTDGLIYKHGSGTGVNISPLRGSQEKLSGGGVASGPLSFMRGYDAFAGAIKSGGKTRRAARIVLMDVDHPDVLEFIRCKTVEEGKIDALRLAGYTDGLNGEAAASVAFQNENHSVRVTDEFMRAVESRGEWLSVPRTGVGPDAYVLDTADAVLHEMAKAAWACGDPGLQFTDTVDKMHTCPESGPITACNPCGEFVFLDWSACNLASLNLMKFIDERGVFKIQEFKQAARVSIICQDLLVDLASYPDERIRKTSVAHRPLGLGYTNLGATLMALGLPYDSDEGRGWAAAVTSLMTAQAYTVSAELAEVFGPFAAYEQNKEPTRRVLEAHVRSNDRLASTDIIGVAADRLWAGLSSDFMGHHVSVRNAQVTLLAPTGTISFMMDCTSTGIEPVLALRQTKALVGGGEIVTLAPVERGLRAIGCGREEVEIILENAKLRGSASGPRFGASFEVRHLLQTALGDNVVSPDGHVKMMAAVQPFLSGAISKTVNLPATATVEDVEKIFLQAWKLGLKSITVYRDGCKHHQPVKVTTPKETTTEMESSNYSQHGDNSVLTQPDATIRWSTGGSFNVKATVIEATRVPLQTTRQSVTHKFRFGGHKGYLTVGMYDDGRPGEIFVKIAKEGSTLSGLLDALAVTTSVALQHGVPLSALTAQWRHTRFDPAGPTGNPDVPLATSLTDYLAAWLDQRFGQASEPASASVGVDLATGLDATVSQVICAACGAVMVRAGACHTCPSCGSSGGCG